MTEKILELTKRGYTIEFHPNGWEPTLRITVGKDDFYCSREISFDEFTCAKVNNNTVMTTILEVLARRCEQ